MFCTKCGAENEVSSKYCTKCGNELLQEFPSVGAELMPARKKGNIWAAAGLSLSIAIGFSVWLINKKQNESVVGSWSCEIAKKNGGVLKGAQFAEPHYKFSSDGSYEYNVNPGGINNSFYLIYYGKYIQNDNFLDVHIYESKTHFIRDGEVKAMSVDYSNQYSLSDITENSFRIELESQNNEVLKQSEYIESCKKDILN